MKAFGWIVVFALLPSCDSSGSGTGSNTGNCTDAGCPSRDASAGSGGNAGTSVHPAGGASGSAMMASGGRGAASNGGNPGAGGTAGPGGAAGNAMVSPHVDAGADGSVEASVTDGAASRDASVASACFHSPPSTCGVVAPWSPGTSANGWSVYRAIPLEGADGFAVLMSHGNFFSADSYAFATLDAAGGCAKLVGEPWTGYGRATGVHRAVSRGGTTALVGDCAIFGCGETLIVNGKEWIDPLGKAYAIDIDVANDGRVFVVSAGFTDADAGIGQMVERWLSPTGEILTERHYPSVAFYDVAVLEDGTVALATSDQGNGAVRFQSATLDAVAAWDLGTTRLVQAIGGRGPLLAVGGVATNNNPLVGVLDARTHAEAWTRTRTDLTGEVLAVEMVPSGALDAVIWQVPHATASYLLLGETQGAPGTATATYDPMFGSGPPFHTKQLPGMRAQADGRILFATDFAGAYCAPH